MLTAAEVLLMLPGLLVAGQSDCCRGAGSISRSTTKLCWLLQMCLKHLWMLCSLAEMTSADILATVQQAIEAPGLRSLAAALLPSTQLETGTIFELDGLAAACRCARWSLR